MAGAIVVFFAVWCWQLLRDVERMRAELGARVGALIALQGAQAEVEGVDPAGGEGYAALERSLEGLSRVAPSPAAERAARAGIAAARAGDADGALRGFDAAIGALRGANAATSRALGERWDSLEILVAASLGTAVAALLLLWLTRRLLVRLGRAEAQLRARLERSEGDFRRMIEASPDGVMLVAERRVAYANPAMEGILGYAPDALEERDVGELLVEDEVLEEGERRFRRDTGDVRQLELTRAALTELRGEPVELWVARDISERRMLEAQLRLADRLAAVGSVVAGVAHEINNPLTYVLSGADGLVQALDSRGEGDPELRALAGDIQEGAVRVRDVVRGLKTMSHPSDDDLGPVSLPRVIESSLAIARSDLAQRAEVTVDVPEDLPAVVANPARLGQVFLNVLVNAAQALEEDDRRGRVEVRAEARGDAVEIRVRDDGPGMPEAVRARVFEPFFTTKPLGRGTGLGLSISRRIVEGLGGRLEIESAPGEGTTVTVRLAASRDPASLRPLAPAEARPRSARVLVIDDDVKVASSLRRMLRAHECTVTHGGEEALEALREREFDVVFCDLMMPGTTGMDVYEALRDEGRGREARLVFVTGGAFTARARRFVAEVDNLVIEKPFTAEAVRRAVSAVEEAREADHRREQPASGGA